jgi:hypothetical protein
MDLCDSSVPDLVREPARWDHRVPWINALKYVQVRSLPKRHGTYPNTMP